MISLTCPNCSANLELPEGKDVAFCMYCGKKILVGERVQVNGTVTLDDSTSARRKAENFLALAEKYAKDGNEEKYNAYLERALEEDISMEDRVDDLKNNVDASYEELCRSFQRNIDNCEYLCIAKDMRKALEDEPCLKAKLKAFKCKVLDVLSEELKKKKSELENSDKRYGEAKKCAWGIGCILPIILPGLLAGIAGSDSGFFATICFLGPLGFAIYYMNKAGATNAAEKAKLEKCIRDIESTVADFE